MSTNQVTPDAMGMAADDSSPDPSGGGLPGMQREDVDAALRGAGLPSEVDQRGLAVATETAAQLVEQFPLGVTSWRVFRDEVTLCVTTAALVGMSRWLRDDAGFALLSDISPVDRLGSAQPHGKRFDVDYHVTQLAPGAPRLRLRVSVDEGERVPSVMEVWPTADWHEREAFDFFGINFSGRTGVRRLIMPDDWVGHPLRKDYPVGGEAVKFTNSLREL